jgi:hypothetical protein
MINPDIMSPERKTEVCNALGEKMAHEFARALATKLVIVQSTAQRWQVIRINGITPQGFLDGSRIFFGTHEEAIDFCRRDPR